MIMTVMRIIRMKIMITTMITITMIITTAIIVRFTPCLRRKRSSEYSCEAGNK